MSDKMRATLLTKGIAAAAAACVFALVQGCATQPTQTQTSPDYASSDSGPSDPAPADPQPAGKSRWAKAHGHESNAYFRTITSTTAGTVTVEGNAIHYHAVAGLLIVHPKGWNDAADKGGGDDPSTGRRSGHHAKKQSPEASMFYIAYFKDGENPGDRPITFLYNGGPGSSTVWLHMGAFGPQRVVTADHTHTPPAPYQLVNNDYSLLDASDLVFIDAPGTGFSRVTAGAEKSFYGADQDVHAFSEFIMQFLSKYGRWNSPKYLFGESYGTPRSANLINVLETEDDTDFNGVILLSQILNFDDAVDIVHDNPGVDLPYELALPTYAATAWYHHKLPGASQSLDSLLSEVEQFAMGDYAAALRAGSTLSSDQRDAIAAKLHDYTGLPVSYIEKADLRIDGGEFEHSLQGDADLTTGRLDSRFSGPSLDPLSERADYDPQSAAIGSAYVAAFNHPRDLLPNRLYHRERGHGRPLQPVTGNLRPPLQPVKMRRPGDPGVVGELIAHVQRDQDRRGKRDRKSRDVDEAIELVPQKPPRCSHQVISDHAEPSLLSQQLCALLRQLLPAAAEGLVEMHQGLQAGEPRLGQLVLRLE